jgi:hypothetical protein
MKRVKIIVFMLFFIFICLNIYSNELKTDNRIKFLLNITNEAAYNPYEYFIKNNTINHEISDSEKVKYFLYMGIIGSGIIGLGTVSAVTGTILLTAYLYGGNLLQYIQFIGFFILAAGLIILLTGLPVMIAGFVLSWYYKKRISLHNETGIKNGIILTEITLNIKI